MEELKLRLELVSTGGKTITCFYYREAFNQLGIEQHEDDSQLIEKGQIIEYEGNEYKVVSMKFKMLPKLYDLKNDRGVNADSPTDPAPFNCIVLAYVENLSR